MPPPERHTIVRFSIRSLLAITVGVAFVLTVTRPTLVALNAVELKQLFHTLLLIGLGAAGVTLKVILLRQKLGRECGSLLLAIPLQTARKKHFDRWFWLLVISPWFAWMSFVTYASDRDGIFDQLTALGIPVLYGWLLAQQGIATWTVGYADSLDLCKNGVLLIDNFFAWNSPKIRHIHWNLGNDTLVLNLDKDVTEVSVPVDLREKANAVLDEYFKPNHSPATDQT